MSSHTGPCRADAGQTHRLPRSLRRRCCRRCRAVNREPLGLYPDNLPFHGADTWTLYESRLNANGLPQVAVW